MDQLDRFLNRSPASNRTGGIPILEGQLMNTTFEEWGELNEYGWLITKSWIDGEVAGSSMFTKTKVNVMGPHGIDERHTNLLNAGGGAKFRMYDDDGNLYYAGKIVLGDESSGFEPLDDYGRPNAGCTEIRYKNDKGMWVTL